MVMDEVTYQEYPAIGNQAISITTGENLYAKIPIQGAEKGDVIKVEILGIVITAEKGGITTRHLHEKGLNGRKLKYLVKKLELKGNKILFGKNIALEQKPSVGAVGLFAADRNPTWDEITYPSRRFAGNLDLRYLIKDSSIYIPFETNQSLVLGDVHALIGDGEVCGTGVECDAEVKIKVSVEKSMKLERPCIQTESTFFTIGVAEDIERAMYIAVEDMARLLTKKHGLCLEEAVMLAGIAGNVGVGTIIDREKVAFCSMPKEIISIKKLGILRGK